jgi:D-alanyl-D-alanine carboxypeptidase
VGPLKVRGWRRPPLLLLLLVPLCAAPAHADAIDEFLRAEMHQRRIPGLALAVVRHGAVVKLDGYGLATLEHDVPVTPDTVFELASVTKPITAAAVMALVEDGKIRLDAPITTYLRGAPDAWRDVTTRHLLTHTSGLPTLESAFAGAGMEDIRLRYSTARLFGMVTRESPVSRPGERFQYNDVGYFLLGMIIEHVTGKRYAEFLDERFFRPLGMASTSVLDQARIVKHRAAGYTLHEGRLVNIRRVVDVELPSFFGVLSSARDLSTWLIALTGGRVVTPATLTQMWTPARLNDGASATYGFGWYIGEQQGRRTLWHRGITGTEVALFPDEGLIVVVLTNLGRQVGGTDPVNAWGLASAVAERYLARPQ